jgi:hypothetical protein
LAVIHAKWATQSEGWSDFIRYFEILLGCRG